VTAELPPNDALREVARLRAPVLMYILDADFRIAFSSDGDVNAAEAPQIEEAVRAIAPSLETGESAVWPLDESRFLRAQRLVGHASNAYAVFLEPIGREKA
jgi:hypothetical protein